KIPVNFALCLSGMRLLACLIVAPQRGYDEPPILSYAISSFCPTSADGLQSLQLSPFFCNPLLQVLALKLGKLRREQCDTALNISPMAQNFRGPRNQSSSSRRDG